MFRKEADFGLSLFLLKQVYENKRIGIVILDKRLAQHKRTVAHCHGILGYRNHIGKGL